MRLQVLWQSAGACATLDRRGLFRRREENGIGGKRLSRGGIQSPGDIGREHGRKRMNSKVLTEEGRARYGLPKETVEPVFGRTKRCMGFRQFSMRGKEACEAEWRLVCAVHNLSKLFRHGASARQAQEHAITGQRTDALAFTARNEPVPAHIARPQASTQTKWQSSPTQQADRLTVCASRVVLERTLRMRAECSGLW